MIRHTKLLKSKYLECASSSRDARSLWKSLRLLARFNRLPSGVDMSAESLNEHFASKFQDNPDILPSIPGFLPSDKLTLSTEEVSSHLRKLKKKSPGPDGIPAWILREYSDVLSEPITYIFNWSLKTAHVPACFKLANVSPIPKIQRPSSMSHYRPISLLPILSKVLERIVAKK